MRLKILKEHFRKTILLAWPVCLSNVGNVMVSVVDIAMVGGIREEFFGYSATTAQAAVALANSFYLLVLVFGMGISYGITPLVAAADTAENIKENTKLLGHGLLVNIVANIALFCLLFYISPMLAFMKQPQDVVVLAIPFLNVMMLGMIPFAVFMSLKQFAEGLSDTRAAMYVSVGANILNIVLNYILIYGKLGIPAMGVMGSCWATFISRAAMAVAMAIYIYYKKNFVQYREGFLIFKEISMQRIKSILHIGTTSGLQWVFEVGSFSFALIMVGWIGEKEQAAHQIALQVASTTYFIASGISAAVSVRVGNQYGAKDATTLHEVAISSFILITISQLVFALIIIAFRFLIPPIFNYDINVQHIVAYLLLIAALFQLSDGVQVVGQGILRGMKDVNIPTWLTFFGYWIIGLPSGYMLAFTFGYGVQGIWYGLTVGLTCVAAFLFLRYKYVIARIRF